MTIRYHKRTDGLYELEEEYRYVSPRYGKSVYIPKGQVRDGATGAKDVEGAAWWVHDQLCADTVWEDGTPCTPWQAATVLGDILRSEGYWFRGRTWPIATYLFGCKRVWRNNSDD